MGMKIKGPGSLHLFRRILTVDSVRPTRRIHHLWRSVLGRIAEAEAAGQNAALHAGIARPIGDLGTQAITIMDTSPAAHAAYSLSI
jgi:hypothetical protein